ncbi:MAG: hypothetical protein EXR98_08160 [Gemmataceae bacterium]|nr:hypothetical protein [Gemmataceae bacterium]
MALLKRLEAHCAPVSGPTRHFSDGGGNPLDFNDIEAELKRLSAANDELLCEVISDDTPVAVAHDDAEELKLLRQEIAKLKGRVQELEALASGACEGLWLERQGEYEMLLEEKSEMIRNLHQQMQEIQDSPSLGAAQASVGASIANVGQAEETFRLKRELEEHRRQLEQDEQDRMAQMCQMELQMAKERASMARQRQEVQRQQAELTREIENAARDPELQERLKKMRRPESKPSLMLPAADQPAPKADEKSSGFFRRIFG